MNIKKIVITPFNDEWAVYIHKDKGFAPLHSFKTYKEAIDYLGRQVPEPQPESWVGA